MDAEAAQGMLAWPHAGFHAHDGVWVSQRKTARSPCGSPAAARGTRWRSAGSYPSPGGTVTYQSDKASGRPAGAETLEALEFLARVVSHIPDKGQVLQRYYGWYANRTRGMRRQAEPPPQGPWTVHSPGGYFGRGD